MRIRLQPDSGSCSNFVYFGELFEYDEITFVQRYLRAGDAVIDGGANIGAYTLLMAGVVGPAGRVDTYEPSRQHAAWLRENVVLNNLRNAVVHESALSSEPGVVRFSEGFDVSNSTVPDGYVGRWVEVTAEILRDVLGDRRYALAKLDLEGGEHAALLGAGSALAEGNPLVLLVEVMEWQLAKHESSVAEVCELLMDLGYRIGVYRADGNAWRELDGLPTRSEPNIVAIHRFAEAEVAERMGWG